MVESRKDHEGHWAFSEEVRFKAAARRNKLLGLWAAEALGLSGAEAEAYAKSVIAADMKEPGEEDVFRKVKADFAAKGVAVSDDTLRQKMHTLTHEVNEALKASGA